MLAVAAALAACGDKKPYVPQVDMTGHTKGQYDYDLLVCQENARQQDVAPGVVLGVTAGAAGGAIAGNAALGAMVGAVAGGAATSGYDDVATSKGSNRMVVRIRECMAAKGYKITGIDSQICHSLYGTLGEVGYLTFFANAEQIDEVREKVLANAEWLPKFLEGGKYSIPGTVMQRHMVKIA